MLIFTQFQTAHCLRIEMSSVWKLRSRATDNTAFYQEKLEKKIVADFEIYNFSWYNYWSISIFLHCHSFFIWNIRIRLKRKRYPIQSKSKKFLISGQIGLQNPDPVHQRWSDSGFSLSDPILFLKNVIRFRSESCFGWNHTIRMR